MSMPETTTTLNITSGLTIAERLLLLCLASHTDWRRAGVPPATVQIMLVKNLVARGHAGTLTLTHKGRAILGVLLGRRKPA
jgi:hypothetical protein